MATIVLSAVGAAAGAAVGGSVLGLSSVVIGQAVGATLGRWVDQQILGLGSEVVETGKVEQFRLTGASEGVPVARAHGRVRVSGQVIWATQFKETVTTTTSGSGKGTGPQVTETTYSYSISLALALCAGEITRVGRVWADGMEVDRGTLNMRFYRGTETQAPDPKIEAIQGAGNAPAYRGIAYVVLEDLQLAPFGNRVPQLTFEVIRPEQPGQEVPEIARGTRGVALVPGTGEYALATSVVHYDNGPGDLRAANLNSTAGVTDFLASWNALRDELPNCNSASLVVSWFGDDLRAGECSLRPKVEQVEADGQEMPWLVSGLSRAQAQAVPYSGDAPVYGGTPADAAVMEAITHMRADGAHVTFYPFILMEQMEGNTLTDPWTGEVGQPSLPWRGRITTSLAPGVSGSPDGTAAAEQEVAAFFGSAQVSDFSVSGGLVVYTGPEEWSYRRFILHYAHLCAAAGGVDAFCIGSEMRGLTQIRGAANSFPAVQKLIELAADVRTILGPQTKIGYAADWSEYFGYHPQDGSGDVFFHLDPLWADANIDFIGIDNYMPLSDWRDGRDHADAHWGSIYNLDYLKANVAGGEGYDWYYHAPEAEAIQRRTPIEDTAYGEHWVFRYKDIRGWWSNPHHERLGGVRQATPTVWVPESKPIWFTEFGCAAVDKGTNEPNKFLDPKSSESSLPKYSNGKRDDYIQMQYLRAVTSFWGDPANNPVSSVYGGPMIDMERAHVWAWDTRPYPFFPARDDLWADAENYAHGHWINGRASSRSLAEVVREICAGAGVAEVDVTRLHGLVRGYWLTDLTSARADLQPLMLAHGFDAVEREGVLEFITRGGRVDHVVGREVFA
ncbi:MAG: host specificity protein, partial [Alphaproteobacteria bacterium]